MYIFKNAWVSITRNKGRNIFIGIIILVIACATSVTLAIRSSASSLIEAYENSVDLTVSIGMDRSNMMGKFDMSSESSREEMMKAFQNVSSITIDDFELYANSNYLKDSYYTISVGLDSDEMEAATSSFGNGDRGGMGGNKTTITNTTSSGDFTITGYSSISAMTEFISGNYSIVEGEVPTDFDSNYCVINQELAELNEINVGDTIKFVNSNNNKTYSLIVSGIYTEKEDGTSGMSMFSNSVNNIITNANYVSNIASEDDDLTSSLTPTFVLNNKEDLNAYEEELRNKGLSEYLAINTNSEEVENATSTISNVSSFATTFLIITLIIGGVVLLVINMINIRERKYEIGVLRTIGMKKKMLTAQFMIELLVISMVALLVGAGIGSFISVPVSNSLLASEIESSKNESNSIGQNFGGNMNQAQGGQMAGGGNAPTNINFGGVSVQAYSSIDAVVDMKVLGQLLLVGIVLTILSGLASMISIQKFSPLTILKERT